ncbi:gamma-glutamyltransferase [Bradyrhizobium huanghuaihaiense]|uniref:gamma-glutamyltransferase family protein n=1 Tax=Bradyrhizobium huanghuaihaiense TaxID=990078 RepID=UPI0021AA7D4C|nr:gamma-glutamyltransferase [Bradyrhizobium sp. CB3035]UWU75871.1 gamma-glutamyltransferase [Bradyrhizobium sp. CB3035]
MTTREEVFRSHRPIIMGDRGMVVAGHPKAAEAGAAMLRSGGNAIDAAIAAAATLAIAIPFMNGLGGDAIALYARSDGDVTAINGSGATPRAASSHELRKRGLTLMPQRGPLPVTVPGVVAAWGEALDRFGTRSFAEVLKPAIELAEQGVALDASAIHFFNGAEYADLVKQFPALATNFGPAGGRRLGERLKQHAAAATMRVLSAQGWRSFYSGDLARKWLAEARASGVLIDCEDLEGHATVFERGLSIPWRGREVHVAPPNSQGLALLAMLALSEVQPAPPPPDRSDPLIDPVAYLARKTAAFTMRDTYCADQRRICLPPDLLSPDRLRKLELQAGPAMSVAGGGDTSTLVVIDAEGSAVSWVQSLFESFGSGIVCPSHGLVLHNRAMLERLDSDPVRGLRAGFRTFHTLCPAMVTGKGGVELAIATPGDHGQPQALLQVIRRHFEQGLDIQSAIEWPRLRHDDGREVVLESRCPSEWNDALTKAGWTVKRVDSWSRFMGGVNAIRKRDDLVMGGADPRRSSYAIAE